MSVTKNGQTYYFHYNAHGDVVALTDAHGNIAATYEYDEWGNVISRTGDIDTPFGYAGQYGYVYDKETGLYFLKSRYYDPTTGRFTSRDRFKGFENRPLSQNPYTYCENDPVNKVDPFGFFVWWKHLCLGVYFLGKGLRTVVSMHSTSIWVRTVAIAALTALGFARYAEAIALALAVAYFLYSYWYSVPVNISKGLFHLRQLFKHSHTEADLRRYT